MKHIKLLLALVFSCSLALVMPAYAADQITVISQPEEVAIFLNNVAFVRDVLTVPGSAEVQIELPPQTFQDTLIVREGDARVPIYRLSRPDGTRLLLHLPPAGDEVRQITLEYLMGGLSWKPTYNMWIGEGTARFDFFVEVQNAALRLDEVETMLVAGRVDAAQQIDTTSTVTVNQYIAGYEEGSVPSPSIGEGVVTVHYVYPVGRLSVNSGEMLYLSLLQTEFPARRVLLWNAQTDQQVTVIYKVRNTSEIPLAEGIVRSYQGDLFIGSDFIELTPMGGEGSVTVGGLQEVRVNRAETVTPLDETVNDYYDTLHEITMTLTSFSANPIEIEIVDTYPAIAQDFRFSEEPQREPGNLLRWVVTIPANETLTLQYQYITD